MVRALDVTLLIVLNLANIINATVVESSVVGEVKSAR